MSQLFLPSSPAGSQSQAAFGGVFSDVMPETPEFSFAASTAQVAHLADVLASISAVAKHALMVLSRHGITFFAEYNHILNAQVSVDASLFAAYEYDWTCGNNDTDSSLPKNVQLGIDIHMLNEAFSAAAATVVPRSKNGGSASASDSTLCYIKYRGEGYPLVVEFEDRLMSEQIEFATFHLDIEYPYSDENNPESQADSGLGPGPDPDSHNLTIDHAALRLEVIVQSDILANLLQDLQNLGTEDLYMYVSNRNSSNSVNFISKGAIGYSKLVYPNARTMLQKLEIYSDKDTDTDTEMGELVPVSDSSVVCTLGFSPFIRIFRAVKLSTKCKIMKDLHGVLAVQLLCKNTAAKGYPGTLVAFNMLEKSQIGSMGQSAPIDFESLFDDEVYQQVREYEVGTSTATTNNNRNTSVAQVQDNSMLTENEPFSFAAFRKPPAGEQAAKRRRTEDGDTGSTTAAADIPFFL